MNLPDLSSPYALPETAPESFRKNGSVVLRGVCTPEEIAAYRPLLSAAATRFSEETRPLEERDTLGKAFVLVTGLWNRDPQVARFTLATRFARIAAQLMGVPAVRLYHDVAINKEAGGGYTPWHQDAYYWPMDTPHTITMWMPLVDVNAQMGALNFAEGSHTAGDLGEHHISDDTQAHFERVIAERGYPVVGHTLQAGDATFHAGWTLHSAPGNATDRAREVMTVVYYADGVRTYPTIGNPHRQWDWEHFMPGVAPGEIAASPLNPLIVSG
jgi:ectoine hydroxylase-related dioxygenase (phytanoyl-CoA dioxygenase family)